jgi:apurinic endonuclease APN1
MPEPKTIQQNPLEVEELTLDPLDVGDEKFDPEDEYRPEPAPEPMPPVWIDGSLRIGIHTSISGGYLSALESARRLGCNALQIFSASPRMWAGGPSRIPESDAAAFRARREELGLGPLVIHANYLINLAGMQPMLRTRSIQAFQDEVVRAVALGADFLVVHPGARGEAKPEAAIKTIVDSVKQAIRRVQLGSLRILIENTAGMGTAVGSRLEEVAAILRGLSPIGAGACLDTAHLFAAGYDLADRADDWAVERVCVASERFEDCAGRKSGPARAHRPREDQGGCVRADFATSEAGSEPADRHAGKGVSAGDAD